MKKNTSLRLTLVLVAFAVLYYSFYSPTPELEVDVDSNNVAKFEVKKLPEVTGTGAFIRIFLSHGDGTFFIGTPAELATHSHTYAYDADGYYAFAEVIAAYDDNDKPPKRTALSLINNLNSSITTPPEGFSLNGKKVLLQRTTNAVPGDSITYIITYETDAECLSERNVANGTVEFTYDSTRFDYVGSDLFFAENSSSVTSVPGSTTMSYTFTGMESGDQRSLFILLKTRDTASVSMPLLPAPFVKMTFWGESESECAVYDDTIIGQQIASSHDPNYKTVLENDLCTGDFVTWRIDFQNEGNASEDTVVVSDWIDTLFEYNTVTVLDSKFPVTPIAYNPGAREWRFSMTGIVLKGLTQPGASEEETKGYIVIRAKKSIHHRCNAAANAARILFGHNPPVFTETALATFPCDTSCNPCERIKTYTLAPRGIPAGDSLFTMVQFINTFGGMMLTGDWTFKWYPTDGLSDPFERMPVLTKRINRTYTLVASDSANCRNILVTLPVTPPDPLVMKVSKQCSSGPIWSIIATTSGGDPNNFQWNYGSSGVASWSKSSLFGGQKVYVGVWDTMTDQVAEQWILLPPACPPPIWPWVVAGLVLLAIAYWYFRLRRPR